MKEIKPGKTTTEFYLTLAALVIGVIAVMHPEAGVQLKEAGQMMLAAAIPGYAISRGIAKN